MEPKGVEPSVNVPKILAMLAETRSDEKLAANRLHECDDSRLAMICERWPDLPEHVRETIVMLVEKTLAK